MHWKAAVFFTLGLALGTAASAAQPVPAIEVLVYNYAGVPPETLDRAEREAARIFERVGVQTEWLACPLSPDEAARYPACALAPGPATLAVRILPRSMAERLNLDPETFGFAQLPKDGGFGFAAIVCSHRAEELAQGRASVQGVILGHLIAHELGHLLLGAGSHAAKGIMHVPWRKKELELVAQGTMLFTSWEAERIQLQVLERMRSELPSAVQLADRGSRPAP